MRQAQAVENISEPERVRRALCATRDAVAAAFPGRAELADVICHAFASGEHAITLGPPGTAKSNVLTSFLSGVQGCSYFEYQMTSQSDVQDLVGPLSIAALRDRDSREHNTSGYLPTAVVGYIDEVGKAAGGTRNTLLSILNERRFAGQGIPLWSVVGASNELPKDGDGTDAGAFWDRWLFRLNVAYLTDDTLFKSYLRRKADKVRYVPPVTLTHADLQVAASQIDGVRIPDAVIDQIATIRATLIQAGTVASDRRWGQSLKALATAAYLAGDDEVDVDHFNVLRWCLWTSEEDCARVDGVLKGFANGMYVRAVEIVDEAMGAWHARTPDYLRTPARVHELHGKLKEAGRQMQRLLGDPRKPGTRSKSQARAAEKIRPRVMELHGATRQLEKEAAEQTVDVDLANWQ